GVDAELDIAGGLYEVAGETDRHRADRERSRSEVDRRTVASAGTAVDLNLERGGAEGQPADADQLHRARLQHADAGLEGVVTTGAAIVALEQRQPEVEAAERQADGRGGCRCLTVDPVRTVDTEEGLDV